MSDVIRYEVEDQVATIVLNRPEKLNAVNWEMVTLLGEAWDNAANDDDVHCVVLTGEGRAFSVGDDINQAWTGEQMDQLMKRFRDTPEEPESRIPYEFAKPIIAAINGYCFGGAIELALWADIVIASDTAVFAANFVEHGLTAGPVTYSRLPRLVGPSSAALMLLTGAKIDAATAERMGLVSQVVAPDALRATAQAVARTIASFSPTAVASLKQGLRIAGAARLDDQAELVSHSNLAHAAIFGAR
jgi:enoyl-CoA hydratase/carnithine racemase